MADDTEESKGQTEPGNAGKIAAPFEGVLTKAVDKLTSQIFLFLVAYAVLMTALAYWALDLTVEMRIAFCVLPAVGIAAFVYLERGKLRQTAQSHDIDVDAKIAASGAIVAGVRGGEAPKGDVKVRSGIAMGKGTQVVGLDHGRSGDSAGEDRLLEVYRQLDEVEQSKLLTNALTARDQQQRGRRRP